MAEHGHKIAYLLVEKGVGENKRTYWRPLGAAYPCRDGSLNLKLDIHPGLTFNIRDPKSNGEREEVEAGYATESDFGNHSSDNSRNESAHKYAQVTTAISTNTATNPITADDFNDSTFVCEDCGRVVSNEEAHALFSGGAVCDSCGDAYKSCGRCEYYFPRNIRSTHCPKCNGNGKTSGAKRVTTQRGGGH